jgi:hypothetical protein
MEEKAFQNPKRTPQFRGYYVLTSILDTSFISCNIGVGFGVRKLRVIFDSQSVILVSPPTAVSILNLT